MVLSTENIATSPTRKRSVYSSTVPAVEQACRILLCMGEGNNSRMRLTDICKEVEISKSKGHTILNTLAKSGLVEKSPITKTYSLGPALIFLSRRFLDNLNLTDVVSPIIKGIAQGTNGTAIFGLIREKYLFIIAQQEGNQNIGFTVRLGYRFHLTLGAHGKAILAFMTDPEREKLLAGNVYCYGDPASLDMERLRKELEECRINGYASDMGEINPGLNAVSAPVFGSNDEVVGCIELFGSFSGNLIEEYGLKVADAARKVSYKLGTRPNSRKLSNTKRPKE
ncbi:IclR family transcriptional regulator [Chloroflexota bacterium]